MDKNAALQKLMDAVSLLGMLEEISETARTERLSPTTMAGMRITLRNAKDAIIASHRSLTGEAEEVISRPAPIEAPIKAATTEKVSSPTSEANKSIEKSSVDSQITLTVQAQSEPATLAASIKSEAASPVRSQLMPDAERLQMRRRELRAALENLHHD